VVADFQRQSRQRKLLYVGLILALFTATLFYRPYLLEAHADSLELRAQNRGDVDPTAAAVNLTLTGSRGLALCFLWQMAIEKQKRHEWNELEILVQWITRLQPHLATPWLYQSWNLAYNVSAESDRLRDKYFYISRGIELLAEGERQNRDHPDFRWHIACYYLDKIGHADQQRTLRSLFQMSCIDPRDRDPDTMRARDGKIDLVKFQEFCEQQPFLVRRLKEQLHCKTPEEVLDFLAENYHVPSRYEDRPRGSTSTEKTRLKPPEQQFPPLPRQKDLKYPGDYAYTAESDVLPADFDNYSAAHLWYLYAQEPLPPPVATPGPAWLNPDPNRYRMPRQPTAIIFRSYPALSQSIQAERREREGWFDQGWEIDAGQRGRNRWFPESVIVGRQDWAMRNWTKARDLWQQFGLRNGVYLDQSELEVLNERARLFRERFGVGPQQRDPKQRPEDFQGPLRVSYEAHMQLWWYVENRQRCVFPRHYPQSQAEATREAIEARELLYQARRKHRAAEALDDVLRLYERALPLWKQVLLRHPEFRADLFIQEYTYRIQERYLNLLVEKKGPEFRKLLVLQDGLANRRLDLKQLLALQDCLAFGANRVPGVMTCLPSLRWGQPGEAVEAPRGPFDELPPDGQPFISGEAIKRALARPDFDDLP
jgi:hypothetical protein